MISSSHKKNSYLGASIVLICCLAFYCLDYFFRMSLGVAVQPLQQQYHINELGMGGFASAFYLGYVIFQLPTGYILDRFSFNKVYAASIALSVLAYLIFLYGKQYWLGYSMRFLIGLASAPSFLGVLLIAKRYFPKRLFSAIASLAISLGTIVAALVQVISAKLMQHYSWQWSLAIFALLALIIIPLLLLPKLSLKHTPTKHNASAVNWRGVLHRHPRLLLNACLGSLFYLPTTIFANMWGVPFLRQNYHLANTSAAYYVTYVFIGWAVGSIIFGLLGSIFTRNYHYLMSVSAVCALLCSLELLYWHGQWLALILFAFGFFSGSQCFMWKFCNDACPKAAMGMVTAVTNMIVTLASSLFHLLVGWLLTFPLLKNWNDATNFVLGLSIIPIAFVIVSFGALYLKTPMTIET